MTTPQEKPSMLKLMAAVTTVAGLGIGGLTAGWFLHQQFLAKAQVDEVPRGTYVLKKEAVGRLLRKQVYQQIENLVDHSAGLTPANQEAWLLEARTFLYGLTVELELQKDELYVPDGMNAPVPISSPMAYLIYAQRKQNMVDKVQGTVGVLRGMQRQFSSID